MKLSKESRSGEGGREAKAGSAGARQAAESAPEGTLLDSVSRAPLGLSRAPIGVQRSPDPGAPSVPVAAPDAKKATPGLVVEDGESALQPGQMRKSVFLAQLRAAVEVTVTKELEGTVWSMIGCPWIDHWFDHYAGQDAAHVERALHAYAPGSQGAASAGDYIPIAAAQVRQSVASWAHGEAANPAADGKAMPAPGDAGDPSKAGVMSSTVKAKSAESDGSGGIFFKSDGGAVGAVDPRRVAARLGSGRQLDAEPRARMERAFGRSFADVRVHTDDRSSSLVAGLNASAFTLGHNVAFRRDEYRPGTIAGDALLAHELAHVVQQGGGDPAVAKRPRGGVEEPGSSLETEADHAAMQVVSALWDPRRQTTDAAARALTPGGGGGLRLQRCKSKPSEVSDAGPTPSTPPKNPVTPTADGLHFFPGQGLLVSIRGGKEEAQFPAQGGPPVSTKDPAQPLAADPTEEGEYRILDSLAYHTPTWGWSRIAWGTPLQDHIDKKHPENNDVHYQTSKGKWASMSKDFGISRDEIIAANEKQYGSKTVPSTWLFNDFGPKAFRYYRDVNHNRKYDPKVDKIMADMIHTTPDDEAAQAGGKPVTLVPSHGCVHIAPADRDTMEKRGILRPGTPFIVHGYNDEYKKSP